MINKKISTKKEAVLAKQLMTQSVGIFNLVHRCYDTALYIREDSQTVKRLIPYNRIVMDLVKKFMDTTDEMVYYQRNTIHYVLGIVTRNLVNASSKVDSGTPLDEMEIRGIPMAYRSMLDSLFDVCRELYIMLKDADLLTILDENELRLAERAYSDPGEFYVRDEGVRPDQRFLVTGEETSRFLEGIDDDVEDDEEYEG